MKDPIVQLITPLVMLLLAIPLIFQKIPPNYFYGFRTPRTLSSDPVWYRANRIGGIALACASLVWLGAGIVAPLVVPEEAVRSWTLSIGLGAIGVAVVISFIGLSRIPR